MRYLLIIVVILCAVFENAWSQNRGSSRYVPPEDFDGESTRAPRLASNRGAGLRRGQRPTKEPEVPVVEDQLKSNQPPESPARTTGRRVPQRTRTRQVAAPPPPPPPVPLEEAAPLHPAPSGEALDTPATEPEGRPQGGRRRRPKKRRKPQTNVPKEEDESPKEVSSLSENKGPNSDVINDDRRRTEDFQSNPQLRNPPPKFDFEPNHLPEKSVWDSNSTPEQPHRNTAGPQYFRPQAATNRLPLDDVEHGGNSEYADSSPVNPNIDAPYRYNPGEHPSSIRSEGSYVPILNPIRVPSDGASRLNPEDYSNTRNKESSRQTLPSDENIPLGVQGNIYPAQDPNEVIRSRGPHNIPDQPSIPTRGHSEVRLLKDDRSQLPSQYGPSNFESTDGSPVHLEPKITEKNEEVPTPLNRLPNPSEIHYDSAYSEHSDNTPRVARKREESVEPNIRRTPARRGGETKPQDNDNDAEFDRRQTSQYRPPLQRTGSRYNSNSEDATLDGITRNRAQQQPPSTAPPRGRSPARYQPSTNENTPERTRNSARHPIESSADDASSRTRSSSNSQSTSTRGSQRYAPETVQNTPRTSSRRQPVPANAPRNIEYTPKAPAPVRIDDITSNDHRSQPNTPRTLYQPSTNLREEIEPEDYPVRNTLRSRPQYEVRDSEPSSPYEESDEDPNTYDDEYQVPRQPTTRGRASERQQSPQSEYQQPPNIQQTRPGSQYEAPQNPRSRQQPQYQEHQNPRSRQQPQHQASQNPREEYRQPSPRQNVESPRQQARSRQQDPEPSAPRSRNSGGSKFICPLAYGFFGHPLQCDKYYECKNGTAEMNLCSDGLAFNEKNSPNLRCDSLRDVDCKSRPELQEPQPTRNCPRRFGLFAHETDCTKFWNCVDGTDTEIQCPPGLAYNEELGTCDWADLVESSCKSEELLGFKCPEATAHDLLDGVYTTYPHPTNCQLHFTCIKGTDGLRRPRLLSCNEGLVFDQSSTACKRPEDVPGCEEFYGPRIPPKKKPARQSAPREPEPEEELYEEPPPTPSPRRRGSGNRRTRN